MILLSYLILLFWLFLTGSAHNVDGAVSGDREILLWWLLKAMKLSPVAGPGCSVEGP